jgi:hypothetical protein
MHFAFCKEQQHSQKQDFRDYGVAEAPSGFQAGWSGWMYFFSQKHYPYCMTSILHVFSVKKIKVIQHNHED